MTTLYVVVSANYDDQTLVAAYTNKEAADARAEEVQKAERTAAGEHGIPNGVFVESVELIEG